MPQRDGNGEASFRRVFYEAPALAAEEVARIRSSLGIRVDEDPRGDCPPPVASFEAMGALPEYVVRSLREHGKTAPMPIQAQALPLVLSGKDVIGLAQTGSGKTLAFLLPAVTHMEAQQPAGSRDATPIVLVLAPTRELAVQIAEEAEKLLWHSAEGKHRKGLSSVCLYGGGDKRDQKDKLRRGCQLVVATPGRLLDFIESGFVALRRVTYFVLDEADRMLDMGFLGDVNAISSHIRPDRQVLFFSATWCSPVQELALGLCDPAGGGPVRISSGQGGEGGAHEEGAGGRHQAREGIEQRVIVVDDSAGDWKKQAAQKKMFLERHVTSVLESSEDHKVLVFVSQKGIADDLAKALWQDGYAADAMHGGKTQEYRLWVLDQFRKGELRLLVCTDVLGRGIDLPNVSHVVIYEMGAIEDYIHRIGRTGRGPHGKGQALVLFEFWDGQPDLAGELIEVLRASDQPVPAELQRIAAEVASGRRGGQWGRGGGSWSAGGGSATQSRWDAVQGSRGGSVRDCQGGGAEGTSAVRTAADKKEPPPPAKAAPKQAKAEVPASWDDEAEAEVPDSWED